jgi:hypothetical protein
MGFYSLGNVGTLLQLVLIPLLPLYLNCSMAAAHDSGDSCMDRLDLRKAKEGKKRPASTSAGSALLQQKTLNKKAVVNEEEDRETTMDALFATATETTAKAVRGGAFSFWHDASNRFFKSVPLLSTSSGSAMAGFILALGGLGIAACIRDANRKQGNQASDNGETETEKIIKCAMEIDGHGASSSNLTTTKAVKEENNLLSWSMNFDPDAIRSAKTAGFGFGGAGTDTSSSDALHSESEPDPETDSENSNRCLDES